MSLGERLRERRERVALIQAEVARALGVPRELVSMWETEARTPNLRQLEELARLYRVNMSYLLGREELDEKREREVLFRGLPEDAKVRLEIERWVDFLDGYAELLEDLGQEDVLLGPGRPPRGLLDRGQVTDARRAAALAAEAREYYRLASDAIPDLYAFLDEQEGVLVYRAPLGSISEGWGGISGGFYNHPKLGYSILVNADTTPGRQAFTLAHEFAHALFHYPSGGLVSRKGYNDSKERFADRFAAHFLVPTKRLKELSEDEKQRGGPDPYEALQIAHYFRVSYATLLHRLLEERIISKERYISLKKSSPSRMAWYLGMDPEEFNIPEAQYLGLERYPVSVVERVKRAVYGNELTPAQAADLLNVDIHTLQKRIADPPEATEKEAQEYRELPQLKELKL